MLGERHVSDKKMEEECLTIIQELTVFINKHVYWLDRQSPINNMVEHETRLPGKQIKMFKCAPDIAATMKSSDMHPKDLAILGVQHLLKSTGSPPLRYEDKMIPAKKLVADCGYYNRAIYYSWQAESATGTIIVNITCHYELYSGDMEMNQIDMTLDIASGQILEIPVYLRNITEEKPPGRSDLSKITEEKPPNEQPHNNRRVHNYRYSINQTAFRYIMSQFNQIRMPEFCSTYSFLPNRWIVYDSIYKTDKLYAIAQGMYVDPELDKLIGTFNQI